MPEAIWKPCGWRGVREKRRDMHAGFARQKTGDAAIGDQSGDHLRRGYQFQKKLKKNLFLRN